MKLLRVLIPGPRENFEAYATVKGYWGRCIVQTSSTAHAVEFYDVPRLVQELEEFRPGGCLALNALVLSEVTLENIASAVEQVFGQGAGDVDIVFV